MKRPHGQRLTYEERLKIQTLHREGKTPTSIVRESGFVWSTVKRWIAKDPPLLPEKEILELLEKRVDQHLIAKMLKVPYRKVKAFAWANGFRRQPGDAGELWRPSQKQIIELIDLAMGGKDSAASIARKIRGPYKPTLRLVHKARKCATFLPTATLDSYLPMQHRETAIGIPKATHDDWEKTLAFLDYVERTYFDGRLPEDTSHLVSMLVQTAMRTFQRERPEVFLSPRDLDKIWMSLGVHFRGALDMMQIADESGLVN